MSLKHSTVSLKCLQQLKLKISDVNMLEPNEKSLSQNYNKLYKPFYAVNNCYIKMIKVLAS